jgi:hypothetical protein
LKENVEKNLIQFHPLTGQCAPENNSQPVDIESRTKLYFLNLHPLRDQVLYDIRAYSARWYDRHQHPEIQNNTIENQVFYRAIENAESDVALGCSLLYGHRINNHELSPRVIAACKVLRAIGLLKLEGMAQQVRLGDEYKGYTLDSWITANTMLLEQVKLYMQHLKPCEVKPMEASLAALALSVTPATLTVVEAVPRFAAQEATIVREIQSQGYNPQALAKNTPGKPGIKASTLKALKGNKLLSTVPIFEKAWERLFKTGAMRYQTGHTPNWQDGGTCSGG